ncbi:cytochrome b/b6 domain-containing protein [Sphingomicrobium sp. XHP0239]|uniref:cytochrome b/b6 domain-containing protein n=1 Tax=Sphingomicrobium maritimum TaxID=3133972 RepID=UPI0031CC6A3C
MTDSKTVRPGDVVKRHRLSTRLWHWTNVVAFFVMLMSGFMIFNAHPRLYWGSYGANYDTPWLVIDDENGRGFVQVGSVDITTTGVLGVYDDKEGVTRTRAFPWWATIPSGYSLSEGRRWHLAFAWILSFSLLAYTIVSLVNRHFQRDLKFRRNELSPRHIWQDIKDHARLRFPTGAAALDYNVLQKLSYAVVLFLFLPGIILTGLTMSPGFNATLPFLLDLFGGRQSARSLHFIFAFALLGFFFVHVAMVVAAGPINEIRSMISGRFRIPGRSEQPDRRDPLPEAAE